MADETLAQTIDGATEPGNHFVANYPPFSAWQPEHAPAVAERLARPPQPHQPLGLYVHVPFCRKRCDFCYYKVYTDKDSRQIRRYLDGVIAEARRHAATPFFRGRRPVFVYFGGGTPSYLSVRQLTELFEGLKQSFPWDRAEEVAFECEPGTLQEPKIRALRELGVTRLSLGVESFDSHVLELANRAHRVPEIHRAFQQARAAGFPQINLDLIAGMVGESEADWQRSVAETRRLAPEAVTIYQMEVPYNTTLYRRLQDGPDPALCDWDTKRRWTDLAFRALEADGYQVSSAYTLVRSPDVRFLYRDALWAGADMLGVGVSSFSHADGVHFQNEHHFEPYLQRVERGELPIRRAYPMNGEERCLRPLVLQMKLGEVDVAPLRERFGIDVTERFREPLTRHQRDGFLEFDARSIRLTRAGLLRVDSLLPAFYPPQHRTARTV